MNITDIIIPLVFVLILVSVIVLISLNQLQQKKYLLNKLKGFNFDKVGIRISQSSNGVGFITIGMPIKAEMYIFEDLFLITPKAKGYFTAINNFNLPIIFVKSKNQKINFSKAFVPDKLKVSTWNSITIKYNKSLIGNVKYSIQINLLDKNDIEKLDKIKNWM